MTPETYQDSKEELITLALTSNSNQDQGDSVDDQYEDGPGRKEGEDEGDSQDEDSFGNGVPGRVVVEEKKLPADLVLRISDSLYRKLVAKSKQEGVLIEEFASELLAEGLVLRAWEIIERKNHIRDPQQQPRQGFNQGQGGGNNNRGGGNNQGRGGNSYRDNRGNSGGGNNTGSGGAGRGGFRRSGMSQNRYNTIMEDKAEFLEYVRAQERKNTR